MAAVPRYASPADTAHIFARIVLPTVAQGIIVRRPAAMRLAQAVQSYSAAIQAIKGLRARYGDGPLRLRIPRRSVVLVMSPSDVDHILTDSPDPFALATPEKTAALRHFQPHGVLISTGLVRGTEWDHHTLPPQTTFAIFTPYFHRDSDRLPYADRFEPAIWQDGRADRDPALVPFSGGPGRCPGENLVLHLASTTLAVLQKRHRFGLRSPSRLDTDSLPASLNHFTLQLSLESWNLSRPSIVSRSASVSSCHGLTQPCNVRACPD